MNILFEVPIEPKELHIVFQGGFAGKECAVLVEKDGRWEQVMDFWPDDVNERQIFRFNSSITGQHFQIVFKSSSDFFGRITIYDLDVL